MKRGACVASFLCQERKRIDNDRKPVNSVHNVAVYLSIVVSTLRMIHYK